MAKIGLIILLGWVAIILGGLTYLVKKKKDATLISGFSNRTKEEQEYLKQSGYIEAVGNYLLISFIIFLATYILWIFSVPYSMEVGLSILLIVVLAGMIWLQRYEVPHKRKKMYWITGSITAVLVCFLVGLTYVGLKENQVTVEDGKFVVSGMYGVEWDLEDVEEVKLLDELPRVIVKTNGFATEGHLKGRFRLESPYEGGLLFVRVKDGSPYLYVETKDGDYVILNRSDGKETERLYKQLQSR